MKLHKEGFLIIFYSIIILIAINLTFIYLIKISVLSYIISSASLILFGLILNFFRVPKRKIALNDNHVLAPSDGKLVVIEEVQENEYLNTNCIQLSIFMSPLNVHKQWYPINGEVEYTKYHPGK